MRENRENMHDQSKRGMEPGTKRLIIPAAGILKCIADDQEVIYPVYLSLIEKHGGSSYKLDSRDEVLAFSRAHTVQDAVLVRIASANRTVYVDIAKNGWHVVDARVLPEYDDLQMISPDDTRHLYLQAVNQ